VLSVLVVGPYLLAYILLLPLAQQPESLKTILLMESVYTVNPAIYMTTHFEQVNSNFLLITRIFKESQFLNHSHLL
jgi:hypothetical protein